MRILDAFFINLKHVKTLASIDGALKKDLGDELEKICTLESDSLLFLEKICTLESDSLLFREDLYL